MLPQTEVDDNKGKTHTRDSLNKMAAQSQQQHAGKKTATHIRITPEGQNFKKPVIISFYEAVKKLSGNNNNKNVSQNKLISLHGISSLISFLCLIHFNSSLCKLHCFSSDFWLWPTPSTILVNSSSLI